jgi:hypothetical protein
MKEGNKNGYIGARLRKINQKKTERAARQTKDFNTGLRKENTKMPSGIKGNCK